MNKREEYDPYDWLDDPVDKHDLHNKNKADDKETKVKKQQYAQKVKEGLGEFMKEEATKEPKEPGKLRKFWNKLKLMLEQI